MSWLTSFFTRDKVKTLSNMALAILKLFGVRQAENVWTALENGVYRAEKSGKTGPEKFQQVYGEIRATFQDPKLYEFLLRSLVDIAVGVMKARAGELIS